MAKTDFRSVDEYIATQPKEVQVALQRVRGIIRKAVPTAVEVISYQIAAFKVAKRPFLWLAAWKEHYSLYPASEALVAAFKRRADAVSGQQGHAAVSVDGASAGKADRAHSEVQGQGGGAPGEGETCAAEKG
jgi:uncharacterized protein YdhG (YjbR/CyaY superfamily)